MLTVTARLFKDNQLVGYRLSDGQREQDFTKQQAWLYAKNKQILNVVATGTESDPGLSGTNGFELKKLPEVKWGTVVKDMTAPLLGEKLIITNTLYNPFDNLLVGYKVKNIGNEPIEYLRITITEDHTETCGVLQPNEKICLNRAEIAALALKPNIGVKFANGKLVASSKRVDRSRFDELSSYYISFDKDMEIKPTDPELRLDIRLELDAATVNKYFCIPVQVIKPGQSFNTRKLAKAFASGQFSTATQFSASHEVKEQPKKTSIFNMFKR